MTHAGTRTRKDNESVLATMPPAMVQISSYRDLKATHTVQSTQNQRTELRGPYANGNMELTFSFTISSEETAAFEVSEYRFLRAKQQKSSTLFLSEMPTHCSHTSNREPSIITLTVISPTVLNRTRLIR